MTRFDATYVGGCPDAYRWTAHAIEVDSHAVVALTGWDYLALSPEGVPEAVEILICSDAQSEAARWPNVGGRLLGAPPAMSS